MAKDLHEEVKSEKKAGKESWDAKTFKADVQKVMKAKEDVASKNQSHGGEIKSLEERRGYNTQAFKLIVTLAKKSPDAVRDFLETLNYGVETLKLGEDEQGDLLEEGDADSANKRARKKAVGKDAKAAARA